MNKLFEYNFKLFLSEKLRSNLVLEDWVQSVGSKPNCRALASCETASACRSITMSVYRYGSEATAIKTSSKNLRSVSVCPSNWLWHRWLNHISTSFACGRLFSSPVSLRSFKKGKNTVHHNYYSSNVIGALADLFFTCHSVLRPLAVIRHLQLDSWRSKSYYMWVHSAKSIKINCRIDHNNHSNNHIKKNEKFPHWRNFLHYTFSLKCLS